MDEPILVLASGSPRRRTLLSQAGVAFEVNPAAIPELERPQEAPSEFALRMATEKAVAVAQRVGSAPSRWVLGADTIVVLEGAVLGKPQDADHALAMLERLAGRTHAVITGVAVVTSDTLAVHSQTVTTRVTLRDADREELRSYAASGEPLDKAGAYAIQGEGRRFVTDVAGSESNVIGLPVTETLRLLDAAGFPVPRT
jgi:septum formation protein